MTVMVALPRYLYLEFAGTINKPINSAHQGPLLDMGIPQGTTATKIMSSVKNLTIQLFQFIRQQPGDNSQTDRRTESEASEIRFYFYPLGKKY